MSLFSGIIDQKHMDKIKYLENPFVEQIIEEYINLCKPESITVITDSDKDINYIRKLAIINGEEKKLAMEGHTIHFDGYNDQARDKNNTRVLATPDMVMSSIINRTDRVEGLKEILEILDGSMKGKEAIVRFFCLGPLNSRFSIPAFQLTDSAYVAHSEDILYRTGYEQFKLLKGSKEFFYFIHSAGELDEKRNSINIDKRRIYIDVKDNRVFTLNNQYAGNSLGLKKLALRLGIYKANNEDWLTEHMFIMGVCPPDSDRITYFSGAFPSACGKTSTAMIPGQTIVGDDIAYIRKGVDGNAYAVNIEQGIFGIIEDVNPVDDPLIYETLNTPRELVFSNILIHDEAPYWLGMGMDLPGEGYNHAGDWKQGDVDSSGNKILPAHKNARYTIRISDLENVDDKLHDPDGVVLNGIIYGGRDSDTSVPVYQSFDWEHGVFIGATIESETTAATLGASGVRKHNPMANLDFLVVGLGKYIQNHLNFGKGLVTVPLVFSTNYFLKEDGKFLNEKVDKKVWLLWMEGRVHNDYNAIKTPVGYIPEYNDLKSLFKKVFNRDYTIDEYNSQFSIRLAKFIEKMDRMDAVYSKEREIPETFRTTMEKIKKNLQEAKDTFGLDVVPPAKFAQ